MDFRCKNRGLPSGSGHNFSVFSVRSFNTRGGRKSICRENSYKFIGMQTLATKIYRYFRTKSVKHDNIGKSEREWISETEWNTF